MNSGALNILARRRSAGAGGISRACLCAILGCMLLLAACQGDNAPAAEAIDPVQVKMLATVYISPTPDAAAQQATRLALQPSLTAPPPTPQPTPTGFFGGVVGPPTDPPPQTPKHHPTQAFALIPGLPTERPSRCQTPPDERFGDMWRTEAPTAAQTMACPIEPAVDFSGVMQVFERGVMYFQADGPIWAIETTNDGFPNRHWTITQSLPPVEDTSSVSPPEGLRVPIFGFGAVWFGVAGVRDTLGFARTDEQQAALTFQRFEGGTLFLDTSSDVVYVLLADGTAFGPF